ncbi:DsbA family oxidoreductase [Streptomyces sp. NBC_00873]|uniref:DsbA family oxidoreductase n=1 Tax=unclassified Streptomyces TaxID=2593676 RepID=UPI00386616FF|nr:DsbA family oxidoreductase [Streptomyces sp. NBC_00873]WTA48132.1 DsbA family oxidoreductase [Streptomyces sp. NBC_00842]
MRVEIWTDIACPWCYIGKARFERALATFDHRDHVEVVHRSFELNPKAEDGTTPIIDAVAAQYGRTRGQQVAREEYAASEAHAEGLGFRVGARVHGNTFDLHRLLHFAKARGLQVELMNLAFRVNFADERSIYDRETLVSLAAEVGLDEAEAREVLADADAYAKEVRADEREAAELGAGGVPFFVLDRQYGVTGLQSFELFSRTLEQAWENRSASRPGHPDTAA